jgi:acyl-CoA synthetase (NDP forming)
MPGNGAVGRLQPLFAPDSVAVVGASNTPGSFGARTLDDLRTGRFAGPIHPVNPRHAAIDGMPCVPTIGDLPSGIDCTVLIVPAAAVTDSVAQAVEMGTRSVIIMASGFGESGLAEGAQWESEILSLSDRYSVPIMGPNCLGLINFTGHTVLSFGPGFGAPVREHSGEPGLAIVSQSGALGSFLLHAADRGVPYSYYVGTGNPVALDVGDCIEYLAAEETVTGICLLFEGLREGTRFMPALQLAQSRDVPVVALKIGTSRSGANAALSHTGSLVGDGRACRAALEAHGVMMVDSLDELVEPLAAWSGGGAGARQGCGHRDRLRGRRRAGVRPGRAARPCAGLSLLVHQGRHGGEAAGVLVGVQSGRHHRSRGRASRCARGDRRGCRQ